MNEQAARELRDRMDRVEETVERITAQRPKVAKIKRLPSSATLAEVIERFNALLDRIQE